MVRNYPTALQGIGENSLLVSMGRLPFSPSLLLVQGLAAYKPHLGTLCSVTTRCSSQSSGAASKCCALPEEWLGSSGGQAIVWLVRQPCPVCTSMERKVCSLTIPVGCYQQHMMCCAVLSVMVSHGSSSMETWNWIWASECLWTCVLLHIPAIYLLLLDISKVRVVEVWLRKTSERFTVTQKTFPERKTYGSSKITGGASNLKQSPQLLPQELSAVDMQEYAACCGEISLSQASTAVTQRMHL